MIASGTYDPDEPDRRARSATTSATARGRRSPSRVANAVIIYMMDVSGSMGDEQKEIVRIESLLDRCLAAPSNTRASRARFIIHDAVAREVDRDTFFHTRESGGTMISSAYKLCAQIIDERLPARRVEHLSVPLLRRRQLVDGRHADLRRAPEEASSCRG